MGKNNIENLQSVLESFQELQGQLKCLQYLTPKNVTQKRYWKNRKL